MNEFIAIDFETATESPKSAISVGLVKYYDYHIVDTFYSLIRPPRLYIRPDFTEIHGLTTNDVKDAPDFKYLWGHGIKKFIGKTMLVAHNVSFDMRVLRAVLKWYDIPMPKLQYFCTLSLARHAWSGLKSHALTALAEKFKIVYNAHNALDDAMTCGKLVQMVCENFEPGKKIEELLEELGVEIKFL